MASSTGRTGRVSAVLWIATAMAALAGVVLTVVAWGDLVTSDAVPNLVSAIAGLVYATLGVLIVRRARNVFGWILAGLGLGLAFLSLTSAYAVVGLVTFPGSLPGPKVVGIIAELTWVLTAPSLVFMLFFFPTGRLPSSRWRPVFGIGIAALVLTWIGFLVNPVRYGMPAPGGSFRLPNPWGIDSLAKPISTVLVGTLGVLVLTVAAAFVSLVIRYRRGDRELRQQIKWVAFVAALALLCNVVAALSLVACHCDLSPLANVMFYGVEFFVFFGIPAALAIGILKYRLYEIDVIINRAVVYGLLAAAFTAAYLVIVVGIGSLIGYGVGDPLLTTIAAVAIALVFQPLRRRAQQVANRLVYGDRATPYQVLSDFAERMAGTYGLDEVLQRMASILAQGAGATRVDVWLRVGGELRPVAAWPADAAAPAPVAVAAGDDLPSFDGVTRAVAVRHGAELFGALTLEKPPNESLTPIEDKLVQDLASQAGLVLRNVRLTAELQASVDELRASRRRLVDAQDEERRKIERNLHDGAQQQLVALAVKQRLAESLVDRDPAKAKAMLADIQVETQEALETLRDLARGIYPPLLADKGLGVALASQSRKAAIPVDVEADGVGRYPQEVEAAVYFCTLEAVQNVAKYADAGSAVVRLAERDGSLVFEIQDDGRGFDPATTTYGTGLQGMGDRLDAIGGTLAIESAPGRGTLVRGQIALGSKI